LHGSEALESRGRNIVTALQERARRRDREPLGQDELRTVLETVTNLPADVIDRVTWPAPADGRAQSDPDRIAAPARPADADEAVNRWPSPGLDERTATLAAAREPAAASAAADLPSRTTLPWQRDFPVPIHEVVAAAAVRPARTVAPRAAASRPAASRAAPPGGPGHG
jgi:hypothetical protein